MVKILFLLAAASLLASNAPQAQTRDHQDLRLYRINKDGIADRFWFTRGKARKAGCHNIRKRSRLHRAVQYGYPACYIYTKKDCPVDSVVSFTKEEETIPHLALLEGYSWFSISEHERGIKIKSWYCGEPIAQITQIEEDQQAQAELKAELEAEKQSNEKLDNEELNSEEPSSEQPDSEKPDSKK